MKAVLFSF